MTNTPNGVPSNATLFTNDHFYVNAYGSSCAVVTKIAIQNNNSYPVGVTAYLVFDNNYDNSDPTYYTPYLVDANPLIFPPGISRQEFTSNGFNLQQKRYAYSLYLYSGSSNVNHYQSYMFVTVFKA